jgi:hypothetical protein
MLCKTYFWMFSLPPFETKLKHPSTCDKECFKDEMKHMLEHKGDFTYFVCVYEGTYESLSKWLMNQTGILVRVGFKFDLPLIEKIYVGLKVLKALREELEIQPNKSKIHCILSQSKGNWMIFLNFNRFWNIYKVFMVLSINSNLITI